MGFLQGLPQAQQQGVSDVQYLNPQQDNNPYRNVIGQAGLDDTFIRWQQDSNDILQTIEYKLRGYRKVNNNWMTLPDGKLGAHALMNEEGIEHFMSLCHTHFSKVMNSTILNDKEIHILYLSFVYVIVHALENHYLEYGIKRPSDLDVIAGLVFVPFYAVCKQSFENTGREHVQKIMQYRESFNNMDRDAGGYGGQQGSGKKAWWGLFG